MNNFNIVVASEKHISYAEEICAVIEDSAQKRGTGIAKRSPLYIAQKMKEGKAVIALSKEGKFAGFCYIESWGTDQKYVANSGLIVVEEFRHAGLAMKIKKKAFDLSREKYPNCKLFGLTTSLAVLKINNELGYRPVTFSELTDDEAFWKGCQSCVNYDILTRTNRKHCLCTGMLYDSSEQSKTKKKFQDIKSKYEKWLKIKRDLLFSRFRKKEETKEIF
ncbi:MAG: GNAT family N-acetyltransferase [Cyclobacteriaceae bacterium]